jgi:hypothetical protein
LLSLTPLLVLCLTQPPGAHQGLADEVCNVRVVDDSTYDSLASLSLEPYELGCSLASACLGEDKAPYFVVGT